MHLVEFVAVEHVSGEEELDLTGTADFNESKELAEKMIAQAYPELDEIQVIMIKEVD